MNKDEKLIEGTGIHTWEDKVVFNQDDVLSAMEQQAVAFGEFIEINNWIFDPVNKCWFNLNNDNKAENLSAIYQIFNQQN